jgi:hypothetical protein
MSSASIPERYLLLGLRLGKHLDGLVDGYFGPAELQAMVDREHPPGPDALVAEANALAADLDGWDAEPQRRRWLSAQLQGLVCVAEMVAGIDVPWPEAVRRCYGVDIEPVPEERFEHAHLQLDSVLPGNGDLSTRLETWQTSQEVPRAKLLPVFTVLIDELRERTRKLVELPDGERIDAETVEGQPWGAYNWYLGALKSRIEINTDLPVRSHVVPILVAHEGYPGHHTEHVCKEAHLVGELGRIEASILLIHTPECLVSEGIAQAAIEEVLGVEWPEHAAEMLFPLDIPFDAAVAKAVVEAQKVLGDVDVNVAYYASERGWTQDEAVAYHRRWALTPEERARKAIRFDTHPVWGIYVPTYSYGYRLARAYAASRKGGFRQLLTEQLTTNDLLEASSLAQPRELR